MQRVNNVLVRIFRETCKIRGALKDDAKLVQVSADAFRSRFEAILHVLAITAAKYKTRRLSNLWNGHCHMFIREICHIFRPFRDLLRYNSEGWAYALSEVRNFFYCMFTVQLFPFGLPTLPEDLDPLTTDPKQLTSWQNLGDRVHTIN